jgi:hypothetical protein
MLLSVLDTFMLNISSERNTEMRFIVKGINDDKSFCECCGKSGLQRVIWIEDTETGEIKHFGTSCALKPAKGFDCVVEIKSAIKQAKENEKRICSHAGYLYRKTYNGSLEHGVDEDGPFTKYSDRVLWARCLKEAEVFYG